LIGTPGRVLELIKAKKIKTQQLQSLVLDEVDQLLKEGAFTLAAKINQTLPKQIQRSFFSATANEVIDEIRPLVTKEPLIIDVTQEDQSKGVIHHYYLNYPQRRIVDALRRFAHLPNFQALVFFNELSAMGNAEEKLLFHGLPVASLASDQNKLARKGALESFRQGKLVELLTTDVAIVQDHSVKDLKKITNQLSIELKEVFLHGGQLHTEAPVIEKESKKETKTASVQKISKKTPEKLHTPVKKTKKKTKKQKDKGKRRH